jgi:hypothetical protein
VIELAISLLTVPTFWALAQWRFGLFLCLATAILQDPLRKLTPNHPVFFVGFVAVVFGAAYLGAWARGIPLSPYRMFRGQPQLAKPLSLLAVLVIVEAFNSYLRFQNPFMTLIGVLTYVMPFASIAFAYQLGFRQGGFSLNQFMKWYVVCITLALITVYLEYSDYDWPVLGQVGTQLVVYDSATGSILALSSGIFRASEIAGWHAMTAACFVVLLTLTRRITLTRLLTAAAIVALLMGLGLLTGRRKVIMEFAVFLSTFCVLWLIFEKGVNKLTIIAITVAASVGYMSLAAGLSEDVRRKDGSPISSDYSLYVARTQSVFRDAPKRFVELGIAPVMWAYNSFGLFGAGLGVGTQGAQYFGGGEKAAGAGAGAGEGGLGKITLELGVPGLFLMAWFSISLFRYLWRIMRVASRHSPRIARLSFGLFSFLVAIVGFFWFCLV